MTAHTNLSLAPSSVVPVGETVAHQSLPLLYSMLHSNHLNLVKQVKSQRFNSLPYFGWGNMNSSESLS